MDLLLLSVPELLLPLQVASALRTQLQMQKVAQVAITMQLGNQHSNQQSQEARQPVA
jgi:hypothetical protein